MDSAFLSARPPPRRMPGETCSSNSRARARPRTVFTGSCDFSKRMDASVRSLSATDVLRTLVASKQALSSTIRLVAGPMALSRPPMTPAIAMGPLESAMTRLDGFRLYFSSLSATIWSPARALRTKMVSPASLSASKACIGWASSDMTKFVTSTMLLIEFRPMASRRYCSQSGDGATVMFSKTSAL